MRPFKGNLQILKSFNSWVINNYHRCCILYNRCGVYSIRNIPNFASAEIEPQTNSLTNVSGSIFLG